MDGRPVWLASVSYRDGTGALIPTGRWEQRVRRQGERTLARVLDGVGDESREVLFRMNVTLCRHRGLSDEEEAGLPASFHEFCPTDTAGTAVELLWRKGTTSPAVEPCESPGRLPVPGNTNPEIWLPDPCGRCGPCRARERARLAA